MPINHTPIQPDYLLPAFVVLLLLFMGACCLIAFLWESCRTLRIKTCGAKASYYTIESRCRAILDAVGYAWPEIHQKRGEEFINALRLRLNLSVNIEGNIRELLDDRPIKTGYFDPIEVIRITAAKIRELHQTRALLDEANVGNAGFQSTSAAGISERVSMLCNMMKRMKHAIDAPGISPAFVWMNDGLEKRGADMLCAFATALARKMYAKQKQLRAEHYDPSEWANRTTEWPIPDAQASLLECVAKGDPIDVALFAAFLWYHEEETSLMGYMSMTPGLEQAVRLVLDNKLHPICEADLPSKVQPKFEVPALFTHCQTCGCELEVNHSMESGECIVCKRNREEIEKDSF